ncbi:EamA family transporter [Paenibacillus hodogayensis]|uniref:EamA family transporter n=1 Tax=Paenibacillus hodogayensis TaxID=279208 RepID=A0ABV5VSA0_9BACL
MGYFYIIGTILFTVYGQLIIKWRVGRYGALPETLIEKLRFLVKVFSDIYILSGFLSAFVASVLWIGAMTKFEISYAYPFMSLSFVLVFFSSIFLFNESISLLKVVGLLIIVLGVIITSKSL